MYNPIREIARWASPSLFAFLKGVRLLVDKNSFLNTSGLLHSYKMDLPCKPDGSALPWMNYNIIAFLEERLDKQLILFEYGSGYSTLFYASHVSQVISVEYDPIWYNKIKYDLPSNAQILFRSLEAGEYCQAILESHRLYDVVVIDGRERVCCAETAKQVLSPDGVILFDDSHRERYQSAIRDLLVAGFKKLDFMGFKPTGSEMDQSSIFYRSMNCLGI
jgi:hypothetical protein